MKIVFLTSAYENVAGYWRSFYLAKYLAARGHTVYMVAQTNTYKTTKKCIDNVHLYLLPSFSSKKSPSMLTSLISLPFQIGFNTLSIFTKKIDILHVFDALFPQNALPIIMSKMKSANHRPLIFVDWDDQWGRGGILDTFQKNLGSPIINFLTFLEEKIPLYGDAVTVTNQTLKKRALNVGVKPEKILSLPNGTNMKSVDYVDEQTARELVNLPKNAIIYMVTKSSFDSITPYDDPLWDLLVAHKAVNKIYPNAFLVFLGKESERCITLARRFDLEKNVISLGWQPADKYFIHLAAPDFFLLLLRAYNNFDASRVPLRLLDYMALGKLVIATDYPEIRTLLNNYGLFTKANDPEDLAEKIIEVIKNLDSWKRIADKAKERIIRNYSWKNIAKELEQKYYFFCRLKN